MKSKCHRLAQRDGLVHTVEGGLVLEEDWVDLVSCL